MQAMDRSFPPVWRAAGVLVGVLLCVANLSAQGPPAAQPAPKVLVADVLVQGNKFVPTQQIMAQIKTRAGGEFSPDRVQDDTRTLWATGQFTNVLANMQTLADGRVTTTPSISSPACGSANRSTPSATKWPVRRSSKSSTTTAGPSPAASCCAATSPATRK
jgi:hypothetical protein